MISCWTKIFRDIHYLAVKCLSKNHKLVRSIFWGSFRNHKAVRDMLREKSPSSSAPLHFVASTLRSISRESLVNLGQCIIKQIFKKYNFSSLKTHRYFFFVGRDIVKIPMDMNSTFYKYLGIFVNPNPPDGGA